MKIKVVGRKSRVFRVRHTWILLLVLLHSSLQGLVLLNQKIYFPEKVILSIKLDVIKYLSKHGPTSTQKSLLKAHSLFLSSSQTLRIPTPFAGICGQCPLSLDMRLSLWLSQDHWIKIHSDKLPFHMIHTHRWTRGRSTQACFEEGRVWVCVLLGLFNPGCETHSHFRNLVRF